MMSSTFQPGKLRPGLSRRFDYRHSAARCYPAVSAGMDDSEHVRTFESTFGLFGRLVTVVSQVRLVVIRLEFLNHTVCPTIDRPKIKSRCTGRFVLS